MTRHHRESIHLRRLACGAAALLTAWTFGAAARAVTIPYGDFAGATVDYLGVEEVVNPGNGLFGAPTVAGDAIDFNPSGFNASTNGADSDINDSNLRFTVMAKPGKAISNIFLSEAGDTALTGLSGDAATSVTATVFVDILEVDGTTPVSVSTGPLSMTFTPSGGTYQLSVDGSGPSYQTGWTGSLLVDFGPYLASAGIGGRATKAFVSLDNTLTATSTAGASAFIQKKDADGLTVTVNIVPEPSTIASAMIALIVGGFAARKK